MDRYISGTTGMRNLRRPHKSSLRVSKLFMRIILLGNYKDVLYSPALLRSLVVDYRYQN